MTDPIPDPDDYFSVADVLPEAPPVAPATLSALEKLGPSPFPKSGFPFLGFLATVYDQIAAHVPPCQRISSDSIEAV